MDRKCHQKACVEGLVLSLVTQSLRSPYHWIKRDHWDNPTHRAGNRWTCYLLTQLGGGSNVWRALLEVVRHQGCAQRADLILVPSSLPHLCHEVFYHSGKKYNDKIHHVGQVPKEFLGLTLAPSDSMVPISCRCCPTTFLTHSDSPSLPSSTWSTRIWSFWSRTVSSASLSSWLWHCTLREATFCPMSLSWGHWEAS